MSNRGYVFVSLVLSILFLLILPGSINSAQSNSLSAEFYVGPPMTESFTYQGYFEYAGNPANGSFDFRITIWDQDILGTEIASCQVLDDIFIKDGLFSFHLIPNISMNLVFNGEGR